VLCKNGKVDWLGGAVGRVTSRLPTILELSVNSPLGSTYVICWWKGDLSTAIP
jgi:hypothetical protein